MTGDLFSATVVPPICDYCGGDHRAAVHTDPIVAVEAARAAAAAGDPIPAMMAIDVAEILVAKNRQGPTGVARVAWQGEHTLFADLYEHGPEDFRDGPPEDEQGSLPLQEAG